MTIDAKTYIRTNLNKEVPQWQTDLEQNSEFNNNAFIHNIIHEPNSGLCYRTYNANDARDANSIPIVALCAWSLNSLTFDKVAKQLNEQSHEFYALDLHGMGMTAHIAQETKTNKKGYTCAMQVNSVKTWTDNVLGNRPYILLGQELGAIISGFMISDKKDERIKGLVMINNKADQNFPSQVALYRKFLFLPGSETIFQQCLKQERFNISSLGFGSYFNKISNLKSKSFKDRILSPLVDTIPEQSAFIKGWDLTKLDADAKAINEMYAQIEVPIAMVWGMNDKNFPIENAHIIKDNTKTDNAKIVITEVNDCGAFVQEEQPKILADALVDFISNLH